MKKQSFKKLVLIIKPNDMKKKILIKNQLILSGLFSLFSFLVGYSQLSVDESTTPAQMVDIITGGSVTATNVTYIGANSQSGSFVASGSSITDIGFADGILLTTSKASLIADDASGNLNYHADQDNSDQDLGILIGEADYGNNTNDANILEFDFIAVGNTLQFSYVFGSDEYQSFVCSAFNDAFGFFLSGGSISGGLGLSNDAINLATLPGGSIPVSINTVNDGVADGTASNCANIDPNWQTNTVFYRDNSSSTTVEFYGETVVLTAEASLVPGVQYHLKLAVCDVGFWNRDYDSGVFIQAGSFTTEPATCNAGPNQTLCDTTTTLAASSPATGTWSVVSGSGSFVLNTDPNTIANGLSVGTNVFRWTATDLSCTSDVTITVATTPAVPTITTAAPTCAADGNSTVTNYNAALTYTFSPTGPSAGALGAINGMTVGTAYTVTAGNGSCTSVASTGFTNVAMLTTPAVPTINTVAPTCAADGNSTVSNYDNTATYTFDPIGPTVGAGGVITGMTLGTPYTVTAGNGSCTSVASTGFTNVAMLITPAVPTINTVAPTCAADGNSTVANYDNTATYTFIPVGPTVGAGGVITGMTIGTPYTVTAGNGSCTSVASTGFTNVAMLTTPAVPTINTVAPTCAADGNSTVSNYDNTATYTFDPIGPTVGAGGVITGMTLGTPYTVTAGNGSCTSVASTGFTNVAMLITPAVPTINTVAPTCAADGNSTVANYDNTATYTFIPVGPTVGAGGVITGMTIGTPYTVTAGNGSCTSVASAGFTNVAMLTTPAVPTINTVAPTCAADGNSTVANYDNTATYTFIPVGPTVGAGGVITGMTIGTPYTVTAGNGSCTSVASAGFTNVLMLVIPTTPTGSVTTQTTCNNPFGTIEATAPVLNANEEYVLTGPDMSGTIQINNTDGLFSSLIAGDYTLHVSNLVSGCISNVINLTVDTVTVIPSFNLINGCDGVDYLISVELPNSTYTYNWFDSSGTLIGIGYQIIVTDADTYEVQASTGSCTESEYITVSSTYCSIPKGLSPNGDGLNDTWELSNLDIKQVKIFNRYGTEIYSKESYTNEWNGTSKKGEELPSATYYYVIWFNNGQSTTGWVYLNR